MASLIVSVDGRKLCGARFSPGEQEEYEFLRQEKEWELFNIIFGIYQSQIVGFSKRNYCRKIYTIEKIAHKSFVLKFMQFDFDYFNE